MIVVILGSELSNDNDTENDTASCSSGDTNEENSIKKFCFDNYLKNFHDTLINCFTLLSNNQMKY